MSEDVMKMQQAALPYVMRQHQTRDIWDVMIAALMERKP